MLPHTFPFRFLDRSGEVEGTLRIQLSGHAFWGRGPQKLSLPLAVEMMAQAAVLEAPEGSGEHRGFLAGIQDAHLAGEAGPGDTLEARTELLGRLGGLVKVRGRLIGRGGEAVAEADLLLALEGV